jgi:hypothetical protein
MAIIAISFFILESLKVREPVEEPLPKPPGICAYNTEVDNIVKNNGKKIFMRFLHKTRLILGKYLSLPQNQLTVRQRARFWKSLNCPEISFRR